MIVRTSFDVRKVLVNKYEDGFDNWLVLFVTGWDTEDATYHMGMELRFPGQNFSFRVGRSSEKQFNPKIVRLNYGFSIWYQSVEFIATIDNSELEPVFADDTYENSATRFELRFGIR